MKRVKIIKKVLRDTIPKSSIGCVRVFKNKKKESNKNSCRNFKKSQEE